MTIIVKTADNSSLSSCSRVKTFRNANVLTGKHYTSFWAIGRIRGFGNMDIRKFSSGINSYMSISIPSAITTHKNLKLRCKFIIELKVAAHVN